MGPMLAALEGKRVALAHHWLLSMRGGEKVLQAIAELLPGAPIFTLLYDRDELCPALGRRSIRASFLQRLPGARSNHRYALPLYPLAAGRLDCREFDVVICSDAATVKAVRCRPEALKICYCHSPMRYVWNLRDEYRRQMPVWTAAALRLVGPYVRQCDRRAANTVTTFIANSRHVRARIRNCYGRESVVIYPPVDIPASPASETPDEYYLVVSELVEYKRVDLAVEACTLTGRRLIVVGDGPLGRRLRRRAGPTVSFWGRVANEEVARLMAGCRALLFCGEEDFGMVPVEAQGHGRPVIALARGGALETVLDGQTGLFFAEPRAELVIEVLERFEDSATLWPPQAIHDHAYKFTLEQFRRRFIDFISWAVGAWEAGGPQAVRQACERGHAMALERR